VAINHQKAQVLEEEVAGGELLLEEGVAAGELVLPFRCSLLCFLNS